MEHLEELRNLVLDCLDKHMHSSAAFFADKLLTLSQSCPSDVYLLAQAYFHNKQYRRVLHLLRSEGMLEYGGLKFKIIAARCLAEVKEWDDCLTLLGEEDAELEEENGFVVHFREDSGMDPVAVLCFLRGSAYEALDNRVKSLHWYQAALQSDPCCFEAFEKLVGSCVLTEQQELALLHSLHFPPHMAWLQTLYMKVRDSRGRHSKSAEQREEGVHAFAAAARVTLECEPAEEEEEEQGEGARPQQQQNQQLEGRAQGHGQPPPPPPPLTAPSKDVSSALLSANLDVVCCQALLALQRGDFNSAYQTSHSVLQQDPYRLSVMPCHLAAGVALGRKNELFRLAHLLVEESPHSALSWYAVACYYMCVQQWEHARRYCHKSTSLDSSFLPAWLACGHAYAAQEESDQAMAAYRTAHRAFPGCHLALLYMGVEYQRNHSLGLARRCLEDARVLCPQDPLVHHELGVHHFNAHRYKEAAHEFDAALRQVQSATALVLWEPTVFNLAHCLRKMGQCAAAVGQYERALGLVPAQAGTFAAMGFTYHLMGNFGKAIDNYHKALGLKGDDSITSELLTQALSEESNCYSNAEMTA